MGKVKEKYLDDLIESISIEDGYGKRDMFLATAIRERSAQMLVQLAEEVEMAAYQTSKRYEKVNALNCAGALYYMGYSTEQALDMLKQSKTLIVRCKLDKDRLRLTYLLDKLIEVGLNPKDLHSSFTTIGG
jgi:hypothetical protein